MLLLNLHVFSLFPWNPSGISIKISSFKISSLHVRTLFSHHTSSFFYFLARLSWIAILWFLFWLLLTTTDWCKGFHVIHSRTLLHLIAISQALYLLCPVPRIFSQVEYPFTFNYPFILTIKIVSVLVFNIMLIRKSFCDTPWNRIQADDFFERLNECLTFVKNYGKYGCL